MIEQELIPLIPKRFKSDARYREGHLRVINALPQRRVLGLHIPAMKEVAYTLMKNYGQSIIDRVEQEEASALFHEEIMVWGFMINIEKISYEKRVERLEKFVPQIDNWAVCDSFCANAKWAMRVEKFALWEHLQRWYASSNEFEVRYALVMSMTYMMEEEWIEKVFEKIENLNYSRISSNYVFQKGKSMLPQLGFVAGHSPYYVRMAVAWLLATALYKYPEQTRLFVNRNTLPEDVKKMYVRKVKDSYRTRNVLPF